MPWSVDAMKSMIDWHCRQKGVAQFPCGKMQLTVFSMDAWCEKSAKICENSCVFLFLVGSATVWLRKWNSHWHGTDTSPYHTLLSLLPPTHPCDAHFQKSLTCEILIKTKMKIMQRRLPAAANLLKKQPTCNSSNKNNKNDKNNNSNNSNKTYKNKQLQQQQKMSNEHVKNIKSISGGRHCVGSLATHTSMCRCASVRG